MKRFIITEDEKKRILKMHLKEQGVLTPDNETGKESLVAMKDSIEKMFRSKGYWGPSSDDSLLMVSKKPNNSIGNTTGEVLSMVSLDKRTLVLVNFLMLKPNPVGTSSESKSETRVFSCVIKDLGSSKYDAYCYEGKLSGKINPDRLVRMNNYKLEKGARKRLSLVKRLNLDGTGVLRLLDNFGPENMNL